MTSKTILIVDDDSRIRDMLARILFQNGYRVYSAASATEARHLLNLHSISLIVLDIMMPVESGYQFLSYIRRADSPYANLPVIFLSAKSALDEKVTGLKVGADDYVAKPFEPEELLARIEAILRRMERRTNSLHKQEVLSLGNFTFDLSKGYLFHGKEEIILSSSEAMLLKILAQRPHEPFTRDELAQRIGHQVSTRTVDVQIMRLRNKINDHPPKYIKTMRHLGYALCPSI